MRLFKHPRPEPEGRPGFVVTSDGFFPCTVVEEIPVPSRLHVYTVPSIADVARPTIAEMNAGQSLEFRGVLWPDEDGVPRVVKACDGVGCALADGHGGDCDPVPLIPLRGFES